MGDLAGAFLYDVAVFGLQMSKPMSTFQDPVFDSRFRAALLHPRHWLTWLSLALLLGLAWFPVRLRDRLARSFSPLLIRFSKRQCDAGENLHVSCAIDFGRLEQRVRDTGVKVASDHQHVVCT